MSGSDQATVVIHRPADLVVGSWRNFVVWIDGRRVGKIKPGTTWELHVSPGMHDVSVSMDWARTLPYHIDASPGSKVELIIRRADGRTWWKNVLPIVISAALAQPIAGVFLEVVGMDQPSWWVRTGIFLVFYFILLMLFIQVASICSPRYWAMWKLEAAASK